MKRNILIYADNLIIELEKYNIINVIDIIEFKKKLQKDDPIACFIELNNENQNFDSLINEANSVNIPIILLVKAQFAIKAIEFMQKGAFDSINYPYDEEEFIIILEKAEEKYDLLNENKKLQDLLEEKYSFDEIIGVSKKMQELYDMIEKVAEHDVTVLIQGESGTGKELVASSLHYHSPRKNKAFLKINCAALPETLLESELFGYEKGAFTGAVSSREGKFEQADGGTIFLDEIGDMSLATQSKVLRIIQQREFQRVGGSEVKKVDVRIIAATHKDLKQEIIKKNFREDLYYRFNVVTFYLPPLRERKEDIIILVNHFIKRFNKKFSKNVKEVSIEAMKKLIKYNWPGNIRELENIIERAIVFSQSQDIVPEDLILSLEFESSYEVEAKANEIIKKDISLKEARELFEREYIKEKLEKNNWSMSKTAKMLKIERSYLYRKLESLGLSRDNR